MSNTNGNIPQMCRQGDRVQLLVDGKPFIMLAAEIHNSSASSLEYMEQYVWDKLTVTNCNTAIVPVFWELVEPEEGTFDFSLVDGLLAGARQRGLRLVLLWFATWKNAMSTYTPSWVKTDLERFFRAQRTPGINSVTISPMCLEACQADARAFAALMRHLREVDGEQHTVIMVQVENETGFGGTTRDRCPQANEAYAQEVPPELMAHLQAHKDNLNPELAAIWQSAGGRATGPWEEVFGRGGPEAFMAWHIARFVNAVAEAGTAEYALPMYANAWLVNQKGQLAGGHPSGGPVARMMDVWQAAAPTIIALAPDIYHPEFDQVCEEYHRSGNPLIIPETGFEGSEANVFAAVARHDALCFSAWAIDSTEDTSPLAETYGLMSAILPIMAEHQGTGRMAGFAQGTAAPLHVDLGGYHISVKYERDNPGKDHRPGRGLIIALTDTDYLVLAAGLTITWQALPNDPPNVQFLSIEEGVYRDGVWHPGRRLNGDEGHTSWIHLPEELNTYRVKLFSFR